MGKIQTVAVYGSSMIQPDEPEYQAAYDVGKALGMAGYTVMTGGYNGIMEAVSKGASEVKGHVVGVTTDVIDALRSSGPNQWIVDEVRLPTLRERLMHLVLEADAYVAMPGGLGTLHELVTVWELIRVGDIPRRPIICYGDFWAKMLDGLYDSRYIHPGAWDYLKFAYTPQDILDFLRGAEYAK
ncbi:MAG: hypothetical protein OHK0046_32350 [Anaerolineae bacterium]